MAVVNISTQYRYSGKGPFDSKSLVKKYSDLIDTSTWTVGTNNVAYNGMIVAVWLNKDDTTKNGLYFLFDPECTSTIKTPDVTNENNWHKVAQLSDIADFSSRLLEIESSITGVSARLAELEKDKIVLRRDNDYNYKQVENTLIPKTNEICLVDVAGYGIRVKIGDGVSTFSQLEYIDEPILKKIDNVVIKGYFYQGEFYSDYSRTNILEKLTGRIYIDATTSRLYTFNGEVYEVQSSGYINATSSVAGVMKLYDETGTNTDGTMTQKAITDELDDKIEMDVNKEEELLIFDKDLF